MRRWIAVAVVAWAIMGAGPCGPIPGGALSHREFSAAVDDWTFADDAAQCAVEVRPSDPHSVTVNCMSWQGRLFVSCSDCAAKNWSGYAREDPRARIQIGERVYPVLLSRVQESTELDAVWRARADKLDEGEEMRPDGWWTFELRSRSEPLRGSKLE